MTRQSDQSPEGRDRSGGLDAKHAGGGDAQRQAQTTDNPIDLRLAYARIIDPEAWETLASEDQYPANLRRVADRRATSLAKADAIIGLSQGEGERDAYGWKHHWDRFDRPRTCKNCGYVQHDGSGIGYYECPSNPAGLSLPGRDAGAQELIASIIRENVGGAMMMLEAQSRLAAGKIIAAITFVDLPQTPSQEMLDAGEDARRENTDVYFDGSEVAGAVVPAIWEAMRAAALSTPADGWQTIDSAPFDKMVLVSCDRFEAVCEAIQYREGGWTTFGANGPFACRPRLWREKPAFPPSTPEQGK